MDANGNIATMMSNPYAAQFVGWNTTTMVYDLHLLPTSLAIGAGSPVAGVAAPLPATDITGTPRLSTPPAGAYGFPN